MNDLGMELDFSMALETPSYNSSPESTSQPKTPDKITSSDMKQFHLVQKQIDISWNEESLNKELELMMADTEPVEWNTKQKRPLEEEESHNVKRKQTVKSQFETEDDQDLKRSFMILRDNYINLCQGYNKLLEKFQESESDRCQLVLEREHSKSLITSLSTEVNSFRRKEREKSFGKPKIVRLGHSTVTDRLLP